MRFFIILVQVGLSLAAAIHTAKEPPLAGWYRTTYGLNGTMERTKISRPGTTPAPPRPASSRPHSLAKRLQRRFAGCWRNGLDREGTDVAINVWRSETANGRNVFIDSHGSGTGGSISYVHNGIMVYYCLTESERSGWLDASDVEYAVAQMDVHCFPYTRSFYQWDGSPEVFGKTTLNFPICNLKGVV